LNNKKDRNLLVLALCAFAILCLVEASFALPKSLGGTRLGNLLTNEPFKAIVSSLSLNTLKVEYSVMRRQFHM